ncbi:hypothetical protein ZWY2020_026191 [Hordeum vulgare]|nr:hypothetical protein ZWY2020_026191 [Hordeum vulgare]
MLSLWPDPGERPRDPSASTILDLLAELRAHVAGAAMSDLLAELRAHPRSIPFREPNTWWDLTARIHPSRFAPRGSGSRSPSRRLPPSPLASEPPSAASPPVAAPPCPPASCQPRRRGPPLPSPRSGSGLGRRARRGGWPHGPRDELAGSGGGGAGVPVLRDGQHHRAGGGGPAGLWRQGEDAREFKEMVVELMTTAGLVNLGDFLWSGTSSWPVELKFCSSSQT